MRAALVCLVGSALLLGCDDLTPWRDDGPESRDAITAPDNEPWPNQPPLTPTPDSCYEQSSVIVLGGHAAGELNGAPIGMEATEGLGTTGCFTDLGMTFRRANGTWAMTVVSFSGGLEQLVAARDNAQALEDLWPAVTGCSSESSSTEVPDWSEWEWDETTSEVIVDVSEQAADTARITFEATFYDYPSTNSWVRGWIDVQR